jgi:two-component sensor histidine kinase
VGGSAMKLLILFQELVFNAIKYCVFVERDKRFVKFEIRDIDGIINVNIENSFNESAKTKSSGFGHVIIENFAKLLKAEFSIIKKDGKHTVNLSFKNLWRIK